jgi:YhcH/YjgK/YiaL family protein
MIIDSLSNIDRYIPLHHRFSKAIEFIDTTNLNSLEPGEIRIDGEDIRAIIIENTLVPEDVSTDGFECHNTFIDIQVCIKGNELVGWKSRSYCILPKGEYNSEEDVLFFADKPDMFFKLSENQFAIYFPDDVHAPMIGEGMIKKMVIKVRV